MNGTETSQRVVKWIVNDFMGRTDTEVRKDTRLGLKLWQRKQKREQIEQPS